MKSTETNLRDMAVMLEVLKFLQSSKLTKTKVYSVIKPYNDYKLALADA